jgi:hypothetical protein
MAPKDTAGSQITQPKRAGRVALACAPEGVALGSITVVHISTPA